MTRRPRLLLLLLGLAWLTPAPVSAQTVGASVVAHGCSGSTIASWPLRRQLARAQSCFYPTGLVAVAPRGGVTFSSSSLRYATPQARDALYGAAAAGATFNVNSAYRTLLEQWWLYIARSPRCGSVASPGSSNHESGSALDIQQYSAARRPLEARGCTWANIADDPWHYNCASAPRRTVISFQRLWNLNHPGDRIAEDNAWGAETERRLRASPINGFPLDGCEIDPSVLLTEQPVAYAPPTSTDVNGDGRADVCARASDGIHCWVAVDDGWSELTVEIPWSNDSGWDDVSNYATLRMGDVDGDGLADICARSNSDYRCALSTGEGFSDVTIWRDGLSDDASWNAPRFYTTIRLADVNADGREDLCARGSDGFGCWLSDGTRFDRRIDGPRWSDADGFTRPEHYGTLRMGDLDADGRADVCIRAAAGMTCALSDGDGFPTEVTGPAWANTSGFTNPQYWTTLRMADVSGDGLADLCIRTASDLRCVFSMGTGFDDAVTVGPLADDSGWNDPTNYRTLRVGDVNGDGAEDLCARANAFLRCWAWDGEAFTAVDGPEWSDASGWDNTAAYYDTIRLADVTGDGRADACARAGAGWRCHPSLIEDALPGDGFAPPVVSDLMSNEHGWDNTPAYWSTILSGGVCRPSAETCNGRDDDCNGMVDDGTCIDAGTPDRDAGSSSMPGTDAGHRDGSGVASGCACAVGARSPSPTSVLVLGLFVALLARRRGR